MARWRQARRMDEEAQRLMQSWNDKLGSLPEGWVLEGRWMGKSFRPIVYIDGVASPTLTSIKRIASELNKRSGKAPPLRRSARNQ